MVLVIARWRAGLYVQRPNSRAALSQAKAKGNYQALVQSDQMVLMAIRWEAGLAAWGPKTLKERVRK
jgi:hypothetical protein